VIDSTIARNGCSPGFWKNHLELWGAAGHSIGEDFDTVFSTAYFEPNVTLLEAINLGGGFPNDLARHGTAALLSASHPGVHYPYSAVGDRARAARRSGRAARGGEQPRLPAQLGECRQEMK
jgi:hypothetical protein